MTIEIALKDELVKAFISTESFKWNPAGFTLASGLVSPYYVDCRILMAHPDARRLVAQLAVERIKDLSIQCIGGLEIGAIAIATAVSDEGYRINPAFHWRTFVVRKQAKGHGLNKLIEGAYRPGDRALIVDDVLTTGGSIIRAVAAAREAGLRVEHALAIVDREEQQGRARVEAEGVTLFALLTIKELMATLPT
jgi:orotate phosphoribosyltransferase